MRDVGGVVGALGGEPDLRVDPEALAMTARGLTDALGALKKVGFVEAADLGRGFSNVALSGMALGHAGLTSALQGFGDRWAWGVRTLVQDGNEFARRLGLAAGAAYEDDKYVEGTFKNVVAAGMGNPNASDRQVAGESWSQVWSDNAVTQVGQADYSGQSFAEEQADARKVWSKEDQDFLHSDDPVAIAFRHAPDPLPEGAEAESGKLHGDGAGPSRGNTR